MTFEPAELHLRPVKTGHVDVTMLDGVKPVSLLSQIVNNEINNISFSLGGQTIEVHVNYQFSQGSDQDYPGGEGHHKEYWHAEAYLWYPQQKRRIMCNKIALVAHDGPCPIGYNDDEGGVVKNKDIMIAGGHWNSHDKVNGYATFLANVPISNTEYRQINVEWRNIWFYPNS